MSEDIMEHMYCSQQIKIPPNLPFILKQYAKAAIRTQPYDLLYWSAAYFRAKAEDLPPPVKDRLEYPPVDSPSRLSPGFLKVLHKQLGDSVSVNPDILYEKWLGVCLVKSALDSMIKVGSFGGDIPWLKFVAVASGHLCPSLSRTMVLICEVLTEEPDGGSAMVPVETFVDLYEWLAGMDCGPPPPPLTTPSAPSALTSDGTGPSQVSLASHTMSITEVAGAELVEKDSTAGLIVWPDVRPEKKSDRVASPKHSEEPGASSEMGVEVLDNATGVVTEVVTIYPVQPAQPSCGTVAPSAHRDVTTYLSQSEVGSNVLSHSSLKDNDDWIKIPAYRHGMETLTMAESSSEVERKSSTGLKMDGLEEGKNVVVDGAEPKNGVIESEIKTKTKESETEILGSSTKTFKSKTESKTETMAKQEDVEDISSDKEIEEPKELQSNGEVKIESSKKTLQSASSGHEEKPIGNESSGALRSVEQLQETEMEVQNYESADSILGPGESVTVQHFMRDEAEGSAATYSTVEIRQDLVGEGSVDRIERTGSEVRVQAARTEHRVAREKSSDELVSEMFDARLASGESLASVSFTVLPEEQPWFHVPGIGPVIPKQQVTAVVEYMHYWATKQNGMVMPRNINHIFCPPLDVPPPPDVSEPPNY